MLKEIILEPLEDFKGLPKSVYVLAIQRFINSLGGFVFPFLTMFMVQRLHFTTLEAGKWMSTLAFWTAICTYIAGFFVDRMKRKPILIIAPFISAILLGYCGFMEPSENMIYLIIISSSIRSFSGPANSAIMADVTNPSNRKASLSLRYLGMNAGFAISYTLAGFLFNNYWRLLFIGDALTSILSLIPVMLFVPESKPTKEDIEKINNSDREGKKVKKILRIYQRS